MRYIVFLIVLITVWHIEANIISNSSNWYWLNNTDDQSHQDQRTTTLKDFGELAVKMVDSMTKDGDAREIDLNGVTQLVSALSRAAVFVDHPKVMHHMDMSVRLEALENNLNKKIEHLEIENENLKKKVADYDATQIHLLAYATRVQSVSQGTLIKFENVVKNKENYFDPALSYYTCPAHAYYLVSVSFKSNKENNRYQNNGENTASIVMKMGKSEMLELTSFNQATASGSIVVECKEGNRIWLESKALSSIFGSNISTATMLQIYLLGY